MDAEGSVLSCAAGPIFALFVLACAASVGFVCAFKALPKAGASLRFAGASVAALGISHILFTALATAGVFARGVALIAWAAVAAAAWSAGGPAARSCARRDAVRARAVFRTFFRSRVRVAVASVGALVAVARTVVALTSPPLAWDALLYHLVNPARWVATGMNVVERAPDQWGYMQFAPLGGEITWAWAMLATHDDRLIGLTTLVPWALACAGCYALARALGARAVPAALASMSIALLPATLIQVGSGYIDAHATAAVLLTAACMVEAERRPAQGALVLSAAGLGLVVAAKGWGWLVLGVWGPTFVWLLWHFLRMEERIARRLLGALGSAAAFAAIALPGPVRALRDAGGFFFPFDVRIFGWVVSRGSDELRLLYSGELLGVSKDAGSVVSSLLNLFLPSARSFGRYGGFGPGAALVVTLALGGLLFRRRVQRPGTPFLAALVLGSCLPMIALMTEGYRAHRVVWDSSVGRLALAAPAVLAAVSATMDSSLARAVWLGSAATGAVLGWPGGIAPSTLQALIAFSRPVALCAGTAGLVALSCRRVVPPSLPIFAGLVVLLGCPLAGVRNRFRHPIWASMAGATPPFLFEPLARRYASAATLWRRLDDGNAHVIALSVGWNGIGDNCLRYPLFGSHLQNRLIYVPITRDGSVFDYRLRGDVPARADERSWLDRLLASDVDIVVALGPSPPEAPWLVARPDLFEPIATSDDGLNTAYRVHRDKTP